MKIKKVMKKEIVRIEENLICYEAASMLASGIHRLPVVKDEKLVGIVSRRDIYRAIMRQYLGIWEVE